MYDVIILGSGPAGLTAAIYAQRFGLKTVLVAGRKWGGQLMYTTDVENFPGFSKIQGPELMQKMRDQVKGLGVEILDLDFTKLKVPAVIDSGNPGDSRNLSRGSQPLVVQAEGKTLEAKTVIVATGADTMWLGLPSEARLRGKGVSSCAPCDAFFFKGKPVAVVGGGDSAMEETQVIAKVSPDVVLIHRRDEFRAQAVFRDHVLSLPNVRVLYNTTIKEVLGENSVNSLLLETKTISSNQGVSSFTELITKFGGTIRQTQGVNGGTWELPRQGLFVAIGLSPNTEKFVGVELDKKGYVARFEERDENGMLKYVTKTSVPGVFTCGDVHDTRYKQAVTAAAFGCMSAMDVQRWIAEEGR